MFYKSSQGYKLWLDLFCNPKLSVRKFKRELNAF